MFLDLNHEASQLQPMFAFSVTSNHSGSVRCSCAETVVHPLNFIFCVPGSIFAVYFLFYVKRESRFDERDNI
jgi:hypothetical protein